MSVYMTEAEQLEAIKKWWLRNQNWITTCVALLAVLIAGYRYWSWHTEKTLQQASTAYESMMMAMGQQDDNLTQSFANQLIKENESSVYATVARLTLAKVFVKKNAIDKAIDELKYISLHEKNVVFKEIAIIRLTRLFQSTKQYDKALSELTSLDHSAYYLPIANELKGDIFAAQGEYGKASQSYQAAMNGSQGRQVNRLLEMKMETVKTMNS
jgi:predicted negative regulator of RcsB-dependent stress response